MHMTQTQLGDVDLTLTAQAGESLLVKGIRVYNPVGSYATITVDRTVVGYFRVGGTQGNHLGFANNTSLHRNLLGYLLRAELFTGYPVPEGASFVITGVKQAGAIQEVDYMIGDAGDFTAEMENGPSADDYLVTNYGKYSTTLAEGSNILATNTNPAEFPAFPFGAESPANKRVEIHGIAFADVGVTSGTAANKQYTEYLKLVQDRKTLFDTEKNGLLCRGVAPDADGKGVGVGYSQLGVCADIQDAPPLMFPEPLVFNPGAELIVSLFTVKSDGVVNVAAADAEVCFIEKIVSQ